MSGFILHNGMPNPRKWDEIDVTTQELLIKWYNTREKDLDAHDLHILADLYHSGNIHFAECIDCGMTCFTVYPENWDEFQGTGVSMIEGIYYGKSTFCGECYCEIRNKAEEAGVI